MTMRMLIDARHREETRVAVVKGNRVEEFDFESAERKQLKGNIYLAKVTRVEPSLQAAFIDYGGNRHGFLAFSEIHPDYYQIPKEDREALLREEAEHAAEEEALRGEHEDDEDYPESSDGEAAEHEIAGNVVEVDSADRDDGDADRYDGDVEEGDGSPDEHAEQDPEETPRTAPARTGGNGEDSTVENLRQKRMNLRRRYKIQDVIRRRQVLLVQVVKEERGNKGAALTTYLSLAGRYCVLMPNTSHGGGISRKISNAGDRKRLKSIMADLQLPPSMGCIVRTAGLQRTKTEIKRDFDYLARLWDEIRETTLHSSAPALVHADSDLIKRAIRDIYNKDIDEVIVEGEEGFRAARNFMKLLMPSHARKVQPYVDAVPLFQRSGVEDQLAAMYQPLVQLKSGGYLVINPTEALVSIDINSGRSTREHNIEQTAVNTNLEAAAEIARQLRLRDMAGLVVIDFIDMESSGNVRKVEKAMKGALANDRARIQVGRISSFGLFEMSRQRLRTGVLEASTRVCPHCEGTGLVRTASSAGLSALRMIEDEAARGRGSQICLHASQEAAFYVLNRKRGELAEIEDRYGVMIEVVPESTLEGARMSVESGGPPPAHAPRLPAPIQIDLDDDDLLEEEEEEIEEEIESRDDEPRERDAARDERAERSEGEEGDVRRRRRRRRRRGRREDGDVEPRDGLAGDGQEASAEGGDAGESRPDESERESDDVDGDRPEAAGEGDEGHQARRGRRGRRGGRRRSGEAEAAAGSNDIAPNDAIAEAGALPGDETDGMVVEPAFGEPIAVEPAAEPADAEAAADATTPEAPATAPRARRRPRARRDEVAPGATEAAETVTAPAAEGAEAIEAPEEAATPKPRRSRRKAETAADAADAAAGTEATEDAAPPRRRGRAKTVPDTVPEAEAAGAEPIAAEPATEAREEAPTRSPEDAESIATADADADGEPASGEPPRRGWWQRTFGN